MTLQCKSRFRKSVNPENVRNVLRKHKHHGRVPQKKPDIGEANRQARAAQPVWGLWLVIERARVRIPNKGVAEFNQQIQRGESRQHWNDKSPLNMGSRAPFRW
ncbi:hypothetical protein TNCV_3754081 [Trichonephila clavipes]|nr:hypothetical protein TNCV_3754081 [Trichonephila clavipes]